ncbi:hypothetical protein TNCV_2459711 [Trichonephila clavipes]|nr:hypothetical protein TNCV_2459711 [Trichonephila clavipes]
MFATSCFILFQSPLQRRCIVGGPPCQTSERSGGGVEVPNTVDVGLVFGMSHMRAVPLAVCMFPEVTT